MGGPLYIRGVVSGEGGAVYRGTTVYKRGGRW